MKKNHMMTFTVLLTAATAIATAQLEPKRRCSGSCGNPPVEAGFVICEINEACCINTHCPTGQFAGICCDSPNDCGYDFVDGAPTASCDGSVVG